MGGGEDATVSDDPPTIAGVEIDAKVRKLYVLIGVAWLLHAVGDPVVTFLAVNVFEVGVEANPMFRPILARGAVPFALAHVPLFVGGVVVCGVFTVLLHYYDGKEREQFYWMSVGGLFVIILWGIGLVAWNLAVLFQLV